MARPQHSGAAGPQTLGLGVLAQGLAHYSYIPRLNRRPPTSVPAIPRKEAITSYKVWQARLTLPAQPRLCDQHLAGQHMCEAIARTLAILSGARHASRRWVPSLPPSPRAHTIVTQAMDSPSIPPAAPPGRYLLLLPNWRDLLGHRGGTAHRPSRPWRRRWGGERWQPLAGGSRAALCATWASCTCSHAPLDGPTAPPTPSNTTEAFGGVRSLHSDTFMFVIPLRLLDAQSTQPTAAARVTCRAGCRSAACISAIAALIVPRLWAWSTSLSHFSHKFR